MTMQGEMFGATGARIIVYGGYSWGYTSILRAAGYESRITGLVVTPRWMSHLMREPDDLGVNARVIIDNGAYPAWVSGEALAFGDQLDGIHDAISSRPDAEWIVAPDVVANPAQTWARLNACAIELETYGLHRLLLPVQDGMDISEVVRLARAYDAGIFVGGSTWAYKTAALRELSCHDVRWVHVGRASSWAQLEACATLGADSADSTSFMRRYDHNVAKRAIYHQALEAWATDRHCAPRAPQPRKVLDDNHINFR